jgi:hypothetical protein
VKVCYVKDPWALKEKNETNKEANLHEKKTKSDSTSSGKQVQHTL